MQRGYPDPDADACWSLWGSLAQDNSRLSLPHSVFDDIVEEDEEVVSLDQMDFSPLFRQPSVPIGAQSLQDPETAGTHDPSMGNMTTHDPVCLLELKPAPEPEMQFVPPSPSDLVEQQPAERNDEADESFDEMLSDRGRYVNHKNGVSHGRSSRVLTKRQEERLVALVQQHGKKWAMFAKMIPGTNRKQLRDRYLNYLSGVVRFDPFTPEEDATILRVVRTMGRKFTHLSTLLPGRTPGSIKNRYYSQLLPLSH